MQRFNSVCVITNDVPKLAAFYRDALQVEARGDAEFAWVVGNGAGLSFYPRSGMERMAPGSMPEGAPGGCVLEFQVADVDQAYERLLALGAPIVKPPTTQPWGIRSVWFRDPEGNMVNFLAPVGAEQMTTTMTVQAFFQRVINAKDLAACDQLLSADYVDHDASPSSPRGPESVKAYLAGLFQQYPDLTVEIEELMEEGNRAALRAVWRGANQTTGALFHQRGIVILRLNEQGQIAERWSAYQNLL